MSAASLDWWIFFFSERQVVEKLSDSMNILIHFNVIGTFLKLLLNAINFFLILQTVEHVNLTSDVNVNLLSKFIKHGKNISVEN